MQTHRANLDAATTVTCWSRDDAWRVDQSAAVLKAYLYPYGESVEIDTAGIAATGTSLGKITFTVTVAYADANLKAGVYRLVIRNSSAAQVYAGLLELA